jgi:2-(1,2-epoxy-1,2-dihydrophenyl)acetyl-CoA isomerase
MSQLIGSAKARELYFLSERISAKEALNLGLTNWIEEPEELELKTKELAEKLASGPAVAYRYMKENLNRAMSGEIDECLDLEATHHVHCGETMDHKNAVKAFIEKKTPKFQGK